MGNKLMKKAYEHFGGVWPYDDDDGMIISAKSNTTWGEGKYNTVESKSGKYFKESYHGSGLWIWVGTKDDFNMIGVEIHKSAPEGATHVLMEDDRVEYYKDGHVYISSGDTWCVLKVNEKTIARMIPLKTHQDPQAEKWLPEVGYECECESGYTDSGWELCTFEGSTRVGNIISCDRHPLGKLISKEVKFRPIKTERDKFIERGLPLKTPYMWTDVDFLEALYDNGFRFNG